MLVAIPDFNRSEITTSKPASAATCATDVLPSAGTAPHRAFSNALKTSTGRRSSPADSVSSGTILNRSPTRPMSATWKIGASSSLLIAMIVFESFMPARCWIAPEMPIAI